jgi:ABC-2 type transport system ATP-binding protein
MMNPVIQTENLSKVYQKSRREQVHALKNLNLTVEQGEIFGYLGPNGAGKTTTIKILMGLVFPTAGRATVLGRRVGDREAKRAVGYLPERPYFYDDLDAWELLDFVGRLHGLDPRRRRRQAADLIERVGLADAASRRLRSYSKGMVQRVGLAQALMGEPRLVVLDEPMSGLDPIGRKEVRDLVLEQRAAGRTVFFSTHILSDASMLCDRVAILVRGELRDVGPLGTLLDPAIHGVTVVWAASDPEVEARLAALPGRHEVTSEGRVLQAADAAAADAFVVAVVAAGGRILGLQQQRQSLEELFVGEAQRASAPHDAGATGP